MISFGKTSHRVALAALLAAATIGAAHAITDSAFKYSTPRTGFYSIDSADMKPDNDSASYNSTISSISPGGVNSETCFKTGVHLPHGVTLTQFTVWYESAQNPAGQPSFALLRKRFSDGDDEGIAVRTINDNSGTRTQANLGISSEPERAVINHAKHSYQLSICLPGSTDFFYHGRLTYTYNNAGD